MGIATRPYDSAEYLTDPESCAAYLADAFSSGDAAEISAALGVVARARGMTELAEKAGIQRPALYRALSDKGNPEFATVLKVIAALGMRLTPVPVEAG